MSDRAALAEAVRLPLTQNTTDSAVLLRQSQMANSGLQKFATAVANEIEAVFELGPNKDMKAAFEKASRKYSGDFSHLLDLSRGRIIVRHNFQIERLRRMLDPDRQSPFLQGWAHKGYLVREFEDLFASPSAMGYRAINIKLEVPFSRGQSHICELQIQHQAMAEIYDATHGLYEKERQITKIFNSVVLGHKEAAAIAVLRQQRLALNNLTAEQYKLTALQIKM